MLKDGDNKSFDAICEDNIFEVDRKPEKRSSSTTFQCKWVLH